MPFGESLENPTMPSPEKPEENIEKEHVAEEKTEPVGEIKIPGREESTEVENNLKLEQIREELKKLQGVESLEKVSKKTKGAGEGSKESADRAKQELREIKERIKKNDILVGEEHIGQAEDLLRKADIKFEVKRFLEEKQVPDSSAILPGEFIFRLDKNDDESADKAFAILRQAKLDCHIVKDVINLDKQEK